MSPTASKIPFPVDSFRSRNALRSLVITYISKMPCLASFLIINMKCSPPRLPT